MSKHVLIVDDDTLLCRSVAFNLQKAGYSTATAGNATDGLASIQMHRPDLILLDIGLPEIDGLEAIRMYQRLVSVPVIFVTACRRELDEIIGLELGADDYITKPFDVNVLMAHIKAVLRRRMLLEQPESRKPIVAGNLKIDVSSHAVYINDNEIKMSPKEYEILLTLGNELGRVLSIDDLLNRVWGADWIGTMQTLYVHIRWLREKIEQDPTHPRRLVTVKGAGYKLLPITE